MFDNLATAYYHDRSLEASLKGRVRDSNAKQLIAKQLGSAFPDTPAFDLQTGQIKSKKAKKEKTAEELALQELKFLEKKSLACTNHELYNTLLSPGFGV